MNSSDDCSRGMLQLDEIDECDTCGREEMVAILESGRYCWRHVPADDLARVLDDVTPD